MLNEAELKNGISVCLSNAENLINDADLLKSHNRKERAYTLFQLASEEIGKASQILNFLLLKDINDEKAFKIFLKQFRDHKFKTQSSIGFDYFVLDALKDIIRDKKQFLDTTMYEYDNLDLINNKKNYSLYTSIINNRFLAPRELISETDLNHIEFRVQTRFKIAKAMLEAASAVAEEIRKYLIDTPIDEEKLRIKTLNEIKELINEK